ncbi:UDP-N-acetyl glucosamine 2-epimerase [Tepiditoga spiralis]|uniref:UDP-N-acetylglucosamine 2-epimerase (non-hydrolyzing) n=1 Tax=Tepiditoga spiralis TaxID=2108365 RepID=A0A7G1G2S5_9BACT|nr:UDP-N-acetylglucosamine 2-epimerase (non-hydrolyzing) [Tepiditoga spiralis]BBE30661.1 UDP-N-acetyl glucosamine 2-epimerase [Tepiditoga spiralis]
MKIALIFGTRPEAIKMAPVYLKMKELGMDVKIIATAQHREMLDQVFEIFKIKPDYDLNIMKPNQQLSELTSRLIVSIDKILKKEKFDYILVHGDTTSTMAGSIAGFYNKIKVCHVEAGLRTNNIYNPYPEEMNRRITGTIATYHFAPTKRAKKNLLNEGINEKNIIITGNTVIDSLLWVEKNKKDEIEKIKEKYGLKGKKYILMTMHRRENWGDPMKNTLKAVKKYLKENSDMNLVFPVHLNPMVRKVVNEELKELKNVILIDPVEYLEFISLMDGCHYIMTDSGGIQEEAPSLGKPTVVLRKTTERPEALESGTALLAGTDFNDVYNTMKQLEGELYEKMSNTSNPFGNGKASKIICDFLNSL